MSPAMSAKAMLPASVAALACAGLMAFLLWEARLLPERAALFPEVLLWLMGLALAAGIASAVMRRGEPKPGSPAETPPIGASGILAAAFLVAAPYVIPIAGFYATCAVLLVAFYLICVRNAFRVRPLLELRRGVAFSICVTAANWLVFDVLLELTVPAGRFF